ncbi:MAG: hypothetical protein RIT27_2210 [Pseudomonadota bacterium]|jgi:UDP-N-acetylglucosamine--N-acetylmuramyl-(pentapeptide) pyrophosphoryl-undecaprenol N-acetylglucosamine transferase
MAGGTGGHVFPALACATALIKQGVSVQWLGTAQGLESQIVPNVGIPLNILTISGLRGKGLLSWFGAPLKIIKAIWQAVEIIDKLKPNVILGMGGFASGPGGIAAKLLGIPLVIHEQNAKAGLTNRILARLATRVLVAFPQAFSNKIKAIHTGNPLRFDLLSETPSEPRPIHHPLHLLVVGGSLGAQALNTLVPEAVDKMQETVRIWHQTGRHSQLEPRPDSQDRVEAFIENMAEAYRWADVAVCRAGALTISELAQMGVPSILVPFPHAVDDHQTANAQFLVDAGAAILIQQQHLTSTQLAELLDNFVQNPEHLQQMAAAARQCAKPEATQEVIHHCLELM